MAEPFKSTPASRVFGMGLPRRKVDNPGTIFGIEVDEPRWSLDPRLRRDMAQEQMLSMQEQSLDAQQQQLQRQQRVAQAEDAAISDLEAGADIGNIFKNNPSLALSRNFGQFANMAEMARPSKAAQSMIPSLAMKLPIEERGVFNELVNQPEFANNPFAAYDEAQRRGSRSKQHGELVKAGVPLAKIDQTKDYSPVEFQDLINQHNKPNTGDNFTNKMVEQAWSGFEENYTPPEGVNDPIEIAIDMSDKKNAIRQRIMEKYGAAPAPAGVTTAANITSPAAMGGGLPAPAPAAQQVQAPAPSLDEELSRVPVTEQPKFLERKRAEQVEASKVNEEWTKAKKDLESKLKEQFPDKAYEGTNVKPLEQLALQIVRGDMIRDDDANAPTDEFGQTAQIPIHEAALRRLNLPRFDRAFTEPGKARKYLFGLLGNQDVTYNELIRDWAKGFLSQRGLIQTPVQENATVPREEVDKAVNFLNKKVAMPQ
jgi:hypothetical protein